MVRLVLAFAISWLTVAFWIFFYIFGLCAEEINGGKVKQWDSYLSSKITHRQLHPQVFIANDVSCVSEIKKLFKSSPARAVVRIW